MKKASRAGLLPLKNMAGRGKSKGQNC
jgi:hypothetical protein